MENKKFENKILEQTKLKIAISEFEKKEYKTKEKNIETKQFYTYKKILVASLIICIVVIGTVQAKKMLNYFEKNSVFFPISISDAINNGYIQDFNMDYIYSDGIGLKIDSLILSETDMNIVFDFKLNDNIDLVNDKFNFSYIIYNEDNQVYAYRDLAMKNKFTKKFAKEHNIKFNNVLPNLAKEGNSNIITFTPNNIIINERYVATNNFPKTKKLYIQVIGIGCIVDGKNKSLSNSNWTFELNIPDKFYSSTNIEYKLKENIDNIEVEKILVTDTGTILIANILNKDLEIKIVDENKNEYSNYGGISYIGNRVSMYFPINKNNITDKLYLQVSINNEKNMYELIKKY